MTPAPDRITLREMIAYRPLVIAWVWEMLCVVGVVYVAMTSANEMLMIGLILAGTTPFGIAMLMFIGARKRGELGPKPKGIVE